MLEPQEVEERGERVVLGRKNPATFARFQWTGAEPVGLDDIELAEDLGAEWEGDELVTYNLGAFRHAFAHAWDGYQYDPD
ncbi:MAG: hypothetical protein ACREJP_10615 [Candidatus Methylomirabilales bacterium]